MEDQIVEWRMVEHNTLEEEEEDDDDDAGEGKESKIRWIVNKGLGLGKKVTIIGIVISSAPVVLPPFIVISALGFAFSVPFGLAFAGYTFTENLMNKLLPMSEPPLFLEYGEMYGDEEEYDEQVGGKGPGFGGEMLMEDEEKKEMEEVKEGVEMRIQLVMDESGGYEGGPTLVEGEDFGRAEEEREINVDEGGKEEGYEEDVGEYLEGENEGLVKEMNLEIERGREAENWEFDEKIKKTKGLDLVATEARGENEGEKDVNLTPGLPERNFVEVYVGDSMKEDNHTFENSGGFQGNDEDGKDTHPEVVEKPLESKDEKVNSLVREIQGTKIEPTLVEDEDFRRTGEEREINVDDGGEEEEDEEDVGEHLEGENEGLVKEVNLEMERGREAKNWEFDETFKKTEGEKDVTLTPGLQERNLVEVRVGESVKEDNHTFENSGGFEGNNEHGKDTRPEIVEKALESKDEKVDSLVREIQGTNTEPTLVEYKDFERAEEEIEINVDEGGKEEGYEEDMGEYLEGENEGLVKEMNLKIGRGREHWEFDEKIKKTEGLDLVAIKARVENEGEKDVTLTPDLPERNLVEVYVGDSVKEDNHTFENSGGFEGNDEHGKDTRPEIVEKALESKDEKVDSLVEKALESKDEKVDSLMREIQGTNTEPTLIEDKDFERAEEEIEINVDEGGKEEGYEEDMGEYLEGENEGLVKEMNLEFERGRDAENWEFDEKFKKTEGLNLVATEARGENDVTLTPGLQERNFVEVCVGESVKEDNHTFENSGGFEGNDEHGKDTRPEVVKKPLESKNEKVDSLVREIQGTNTEPTLAEDKDFEKAEEEREINVDEGGKEEGYEEEVGEYFEGQNARLVKEMNLEMEQGRETENWEFDENFKKTEGLDLVATEARGENDVTLTPGLQERNLVVVCVGESVKEDNHTFENSGGFEGNDEDGEDTRPEVVEKPLKSTDEKVNSLVREIQGTKPEKGPEVTAEEKEIIEEVKKKPNVSRSSKKHHKKKLNDGKNVAITEKREGLSNKQQKDNDEKMMGKTEEVMYKVMVKQDKKHLPVKRETQEGRDEVNQSGVSKKAKKAAEVDKTLPGSTDARNGEDVRQAANSTKDSKEVSNGKHVAKDASRPLEGNDNLVSVKEAQSKAPDVYGRLPSQRKGNIDQKKNANANGVNQVYGRPGIAEAKHTKELLSEEKIWEKISAMRRIVGYTRAPQPLLVDELKALYIFTGVEPPSTIRNATTLDLAEVNDKLQLLMSIVGVK